MVSNKHSAILSGVGDHLLSQEMRYHCPVFGVFKFSRPKRRLVCRYEQGDYNLLRQKASSTNWNSLLNPGINVYAKALIDKILDIMKQCIPNKVVTIRPSDPSWMISCIRKLIRKRKTAYRKAKKTNAPNDWIIFKRLRNETTSMIRDSKKAMADSLAAKLKSETLSSKQWWSLLKCFISPSSQSPNHLLEKDGLVYTDEKEKANLLNDFFRDQTLLDEQNAVLPDIIPYPVENNLSYIVLTPDEIKLILKALPIGKATILMV